MFHKEPAFQPLAYGLVVKAYGQNTYIRHLQSRKACRCRRCRPLCGDEQVGFLRVFPEDGREDFCAISQ